MNRIAKVWEELDKKNGRHANLSSKKREVKLNVADDMRELSRLISAGLDEVDQNTADLMEVNFEYQEALDKAKEIFDGFRIEELEELIEKGYELTDKVEKSAKELGLKPEEMIPSFEELVDNIGNMETDISRLEDEYNTSEFNVHGLKLRNQNEETTKGLG